MASRTAPVALSISLSLTVLTVLVMIFPAASIRAACPPLPPEGATYEGGERTVDFQGYGAGSFSFYNESGQAIWDVWITITYTEPWGSGNDPVPEAYVKIDDDQKEWALQSSESIGNDTKRLKLDGRSANGGDGTCCPVGKPITVHVDKGGEEAPGIDTVAVWFTDSAGDQIFNPFPCNNGFCLNGGGEILYVLKMDRYPEWYNWSLSLNNDSDYLITGFVFSESPSQQMSALYTSKLASTDPTTKTVNFLYPLEAHSGKSSVAVKYGSVPAGDFHVSCLPLISKVIPQSSNPGQIISLGSGKPAPDIVISEAEAGAIHDAFGQGEVVLTPRNPFEFAQVTSAAVTQGDIQIGTLYISGGAIHIPITASSTADSVITLSGITIDTLQGLQQGVLSVRQTEPGGNDSNFPYATYVIVETPPGSP